MKYKIIPAILEYSETDIIKRIEEAKQFADHLHIDIIDESFSEQTILPSPALFAPYSDELFLELHMMVKDPKHFVKPFYEAGFKRFIGHVEQMDNQKEFVEQTASLGAEVFIAIDFETPLTNLAQEINPNGITLMSIHAGKAGQEFQNEVLEKIQKARHLFPDKDIEIDGGVNEQTLQDALENGANLFAMKTALFNTPDPGATYRVLCDTLPS